jgi:hypothetical protein
MLCSTQVVIDYSLGAAQFKRKGRKAGAKEAFYLLESSFKEINLAALKEPNLSSWRIG